MKRLDKLILDAFIGPFFLTFLVVVFILLNIQMLKYFDDIIGKGLEWLDIGKLLFYFAVFTTPTAFPLAILLSSLIAFGNLGEHFELTAIKSAGISLVRTLLPIFIFVLMLTAIAFYANNNLVPKAALEAYSLLYDIRQKKPALDLREGTFYNGIPDVSIKVDRKYPEDEAALGGIVLYDHHKGDGNKEVTKADSGRMYTILNERYLKFELYNGFNYTEGATEEKAITGQKNKVGETYTRSRFAKTQVVYDLSSFDIKRTDPKWFQSNRIMRNLSQLDYDIDSITRDVISQRLNYYSYRPGFFLFLNSGDTLPYPDDVHDYKLWRDSVDRIKHMPDSLKKAQMKSGAAPRFALGNYERTKEQNKFRRTFRERFKNERSRPAKPADSASEARLVGVADSLFRLRESNSVVQSANNMARQAKTQIENSNYSIDTYIKELRVFELQWHKIIASSIACICMFLIGAPLGAIIKKGGLGVPFLVSIIFFIIYYVLTMQGEKLVKQDLVSAFAGVWAADIILLTVGLLFLRQARLDARLFEADFYAVTYMKVKSWLAARRTLRRVQS